MATIDDLKSEWAIDAVISDDLGGEALKIPMLHAKYLDHYITAKMKSTKIDLELAQLKSNKRKWFRGELTTDELKELGWQQWQYRTLKTDIEGLLEGDLDVQKLLARQSYMKIMIYYVESVLSELKSRNFEIKAALDWQRFKAGN